MYVVVDIEADGPVPSRYSMLSLGACTLGGEEFYVEIQPLVTASVNYGTVEFLREHGLDREKLITEGTSPHQAMFLFDQWLTKVSKGDKVRFVSDNAAFDSMFVFWYFHAFIGRNPFGFSALSLTSLYAGFAKDTRRSNDYKKWRKTDHTHNALSDAKGNAEAMKELERRGMKF